ncbi:hypothetical protein SAMN05444273_103524 [Litoreibacter ascidiaceicola]|uniref:Stress response protein SCP2 n=1 Tax=Litoreibacter ascidiaceicola TaxID=1486859 RepID=A0A1M4YF59_9RHOB|nr:hypothetical protein [Litoreibacter ascidiaceicola]SHF04385.1 hypothetical protein SAMN05444273_103524 [Litoreibacter ascidiaceicola]
MRPDYLKQGEIARLFPVLATTSKEGRTTSIVLSCLSRVQEFGNEMLTSVGVKIGKRSQIECYTEIVFQAEKIKPNDRPDGLIVVKNGSREWRALVEAKVGNATLGAEQIEKYRAIAKEQGCDAVITISNEFTSAIKNHPIADVRKSRSKIPVFHWSWMFILTNVGLLLANEEIEDTDQALLLNELRRFLSDDSAGVKGFERMPPEWSDINKLVSTGGKILAKSDEATSVIEAWHQETKDLSLILTRMTETYVHERLPRKHIADPVQRQKDELALLREDNQLQSTLDIPDAAAPLEIIADISRRTIDVGMLLKAPEDKKSSKARLNWLLRQIPNDALEGLTVRCNWPGRSEATQFSYADLLTAPELIEEGKSGLQVISFNIFLSKRLGARFTQQTNFIVDLEDIVPRFYREIGQNLVAWRKSAPKIKADRDDSEDVSVASISEDAEKDAI